MAKFSLLQYLSKLKFPFTIPLTAHPRICSVSEQILSHVENGTIWNLDIFELYVLIPVPW
jgi:hypothetical protein